MMIFFFLKLASLPQAKESIFISNDYMIVENYEMTEDSIKRTTSRKWSDIPTKLASKTHSLIPTASSSVKFRKAANFDFSCTNKESNEKKTGEELNFSRSFSTFSNEESNSIPNKIITKQMIVIGAAQTGKKSLIHSLFGEKMEEPFLANEGTNE